MGKESDSAGSVKFDLGFDLGNLKEQLATALSFASKNASNAMTQTQSAYRSAADAMNKTSRSLIKESASATNSVNAQIKSMTTEFIKQGMSANDALNRAMKSKAASLAAVYKKQGMSASNAFKKAWTEIDRTSAAKSAKVKKHIEEIGTQSQTTTGLVTSSFGGAFQKIASMVGTALSVRAIVNFTKSCLELGSDLTEVQNVVDTTFGSMAESVNTFAKSAMETYGMSETVAKKYMGTFGAMSKAMGMSTQQAYEMSEAVTSLTGDVASFFNLSTDEAYTKLKSIWTGETETLKDLGVVMTQTALDQYALNNGFGKTTKNMTEQEKLLLRYQYVMSTLSDASGDFAKTSKTWANQTRVLSLRFDALKASLGQGFINLFTPILVMINDLLAGLQKLADGFSRFTSIITGAEQAAGGLAGISDAAALAAGNIENTGSVATSTASAIKRSLAGFDKITKLNSDSSSGAASASGSGSSIDISPGTDKAQEKVSGLERLISKIKNGFSSSFSRIIESAKRTGTTIKTNLTEGFQEFINEDGERLLQQFNKIFDHCVNIADSVAGFSEAFADVFSVFESPEAINITGNLFSIFEGGFSNTLLLGSKFADDLIDTITSPFVENKDTIKEGLAKMLKPLSEISDKVKQFTQDAWDTVQDAYDQYIQPAFQTVKEIWTKYLGSDDFKSHLASMKESLGRLNDSLQPILDTALKLFNFIVGGNMASMGNGIKVFGNIGLLAFKGIVSGIDTALKNFSNMVQFVSNLCNGGWKNAMSGMGSSALQAVANIKNAFVGIPDWFQNVFTNAWTKVQQVFSRGGTIFAGIQDGITNSFKNIVRSLVSGINEVIRKPFTNINNTLNAIRATSVMGIKPFQRLWSYNPISVPQIPTMLAKGGIINQPTLAMVGEAGKEAVMPLENNTGWIDMLAEKVASRVGGGDVSEIIRILKLILEILKDPGDTVLVTTDEEIARAAKRGAANLARRYGTLEFN